MKNIIYSFIAVSLTIAFCYFYTNSIGNYSENHTKEVGLEKSPPILKTSENSINKNKIKEKLQK